MHELELPIGPSHPAMKEPEKFTFLVDGERVKGARMSLGYAHRGIEKLLESKNYTQSVPLVERICGICQHAHSSCFCWAVESLAGIEAPPRAQSLRTMMLEMERIHSHLLWFAFLFDDIGQKALFMHMMERREAVMDLFESTTGNRVHHSMNKVGGVRHDFGEKETRHAMAVLADIDAYAPKIKGYLGGQTVSRRLRGVGVLSKAEAKRVGVVGPIARASGVEMDTRRDHPYGAYPETDFTVVMDDTGDAFARAMCRANELHESIKIARQCLGAGPGPIDVKWPGKPPEGHVFQMVEAPRGEDMHFVVSNGTDKPSRVKIRPPTYANLACLPGLVDGVNVSDVPAIVASLDPCFACTDRMVFVNDKGEILMRK